MDDIHTVYRQGHFGGAIYLAVEACLWFVSATLGAMNQIPAAVLTLMAGGLLIYPATLLLAKLLGLRALESNRSLDMLISSVALTIPLGLPLVFMATSGGKGHLFFPAFTVLIGAHWLPFSFIYSMKSYFILAGLLVLGGILFGFVFTQPYSACVFFTAIILFLFSGIHYSQVKSEIRVL